MEILEGGRRDDFKNNYGRPNDVEPNAGCLIALGLAAMLWGVIIWTGVYLWRHL